MRAALVELRTTRLAPPRHHTATLTAVGSTRAVPSSTTPTTRRHACTPTQAAPPRSHHQESHAGRRNPLATLDTTTLHTGLCEPAAVTFGWLDTHPAHPRNKDPAS
jgi:hypothetical protein